MKNCIIMIHSSRIHRMSKFLRYSIFGTGITLYRLKSLIRSKTKEVLFGSLVENQVIKGFDFQICTYDYVFFKIGIIYCNFKNKRIRWYTYEISNKWINGNQTTMQNITKYNNQLFIKPLDKILDEEIKKYNSNYIYSSLVRIFDYLKNL